MTRSEGLLKKLNDYCPGAVPMHMPGHKRNVQLAEYLRKLGADIDITEIDGFDDLHDADGVLAEGMERAARLWGAKRSFFCVNGSTGGILASVFAVLDDGDELI
ncbi:MAG: amino acid decarboxylase, partial [Oscillospiraceae bacterium]|nr:amino acid decarboxylase [Oscillospiraceae bacterium]